MNPKLLPDKEAFIELPPNMDLRKPGQIDPFNPVPRFWSAHQWTKIGLQKTRAAQKPC